MYRRRKRTRKAPVARSKEEKCATKWCKNRKAAHATYHRMADGTTKKYENFLSHCWKCRARMLKERQPATYVLNAIRGRAKQRGLPFTITLEEFKTWCAQTGYLEKRGRDPESASIDRIDHDKGYHIWNIQIKSFQENCTTGHTVPGRETKQNERKPGEYSYDFAGPESAPSDPIPSTDPGYVTPVDEPSGPEPDYIPPQSEDQPF